MRHRRDSERNVSSRPLRVAEELRHVLTNMMREGILHDPALEGVTILIGEIRVSSDLSHATIFAAPFGGGDAADLARRLNHAAGFLRTRLGREIKLRHVPELHFVADRSYDEASRIASLLKDPVVAQDIARNDATDDER